jgi:hypothetical protein
MVLEDKDRVLLTMTCGQVNEQNLQAACGQGSFAPNERVWARAGVSGDNLWVYTSEQSSTFWHVDSSEAK